MRKTSNILASLNRSSGGINSAPTPGAQYPILLKKGDELLQEHSKVRAVLDNDRRLSRELKAAIELMYVYGLRVSELLNIRATDIKRGRYIKIKGLKGSSDRYVYPSGASGLWFDDINVMPSHLRNWSRFYFYRLFKAVGFYYVNHGQGNNSVTHYFRVLYIRTLVHQGADEPEIKSAIGHKNVNSQSFYKNENKKGI